MSPFSGPDLDARPPVTVAPARSEAESGSADADVSTPPPGPRRLRSWAATGQGIVLGAALVAVGLLVVRGAGAPSPGLVVAAVLVSLGVWRPVTLPFWARRPARPSAPSDAVEEQDGDVGDLGDADLRSRLGR
ncbi:MAG: hypothetical protein HGA44_07075 [Cellulomonadaceae bacterium]|nr:hypothetical protein [Cellulomonadaceae bacterium]